jgi:hypothetical protein
VSRSMVRTHVVLPRELVDAVDRLVGRRSRSKFLSVALEEKLARLRLISAAEQAAGSLADTNIPGWETSESAVEWVRALRRMDGLRFASGSEGE